MTVGIDIELLAANLAVGDSSSGEMCPYCNGGVSGERSLRVTRRSHDVVTYKCYRASCGRFGAIGSNAPMDIKIAPKRLVKFNATSLNSLSEEEIKVVEGKLNLGKVALIAAGVKVDKDTRRIVFPLYTAEGENAGSVLRYYDGVSTGKKLPKAINAWTGTPDIAFPTNRIPAGTSLTLFEDWPSALRVSLSGFPAAALLGVGLRQESLARLVARGYKDVYLVLDSDAKAQALRHKLRYGAIFRNFNVIPLEDEDVKDMDNAKYKQFLSQIV